MYLLSEQLHAILVKVVLTFKGVNVGNCTIL